MLAFRAMEQAKRNLPEKLWLGFLYVIAYAISLAGIALIVYSMITQDSHMTRNMGNVMVGVFTGIFSTPFALLILYKRGYGVSRNAPKPDVLTTILLCLVILDFILPWILAALVRGDYE